VNYLMIARKILRHSASVFLEIEDRQSLVGQRWKPGTAVDLVVLLGPASIPFPDVIGRTQSAALSIITAAGLTLGTISTQDDNTMPVIIVTGQNVMSQVIAQLDLELKVIGRTMLAAACCPPAHW
jgi:hypothetical protein